MTDVRQLLIDWRAYQETKEGMQVPWAYLADKAHVSKRTIERILSGGYHKMKKMTIRRLASGFGLSVEQFLKGPRALSGLKECDGHGRVSSLGGREKCASIAAGVRRDLYNGLQRIIAEHPRRRMTLLIIDVKGSR